MTAMIKTALERRSEREEEKVESSEGEATA